MDQGNHMPGSCDQLEALQESEKMYRSLVERSNDGVVVLQDHLIKYINPRFLDLSGYSAEELLNTTFTDHLVPEEVPILMERYQKRIAGEPIPPIYELAITRKDGATLPFEVSAAVISFHGRPADLVWVRDITERKMGEEYLQRYRLLVETARDVLLFIGLDGKIIEANRAAVETYGYSREELLDLSVYDLRIKKEHHAVADQLERARHESLLFETTHCRKDGSRIPVEVSVSAASIQGKPVLLSIIRDITKRRQAEASIEAALNDAMRESRRAAALESIAEAGLSTPRLPELLDVVVARIADALKVDSTCVFVLDERAQEFVAHAAYNVPGLLGCRVRANEGLMGKVALERKPVFVADAEHDPLAFDSCEIRTRAKTMLGVPLIARGKVVGVTRVQSIVQRQFTEDEIRLLQAIADRVAMAVDNAKLYDELERSREEVVQALDHERHFSLLLQTALLPPTPHICDAYSVAVGYVPVFISRQVGGDFYDVFKGRDGWAAILIGDVSGKGLEAASLAAATRSTIHAFAHETASPADVLARANSVLYAQQSETESFVTVVLATIEMTTGDLLYSTSPFARSITGGG